MLLNYFKTAWRNLLKNKAHSAINIAGLSVGMAVAILISLWIYDELTFNKNFPNYNHIVSVMQHQTFNGDKGTQSEVPYLMGEELRKNYGADFTYLSMCTGNSDHILSFGEKKLTKSGDYYEPGVIDMLSLKMLKGTRLALSDNHSVILSASTARSLFGDADPMEKILKIDNNLVVKCTGVYEDLPNNSDFRDLRFIGSWQLWIDSQKWPEKYTDPWRSNSFQLIAQVIDNADLEKVSEKIKNAKLKVVTPADATFKPEIFLQPMSKWHLYAEFKNGVSSGGRILYVKMFGTIGFFVLLLACINFMNLSTARSEKRAKEIGIRKAVGSLRSQLIRQFFCESLLTSFCAFSCSLVLAWLVLPFFNEVAGKQMSILWLNPGFWLLSILFVLITGLIAGSYPALYLSSFHPVKVLKGGFKAGRLAAVPRKILVVVQFTVSVILIIGTITVFRQIQYAKNRPVGYSRGGLIMANMATPDIHKHFDALRDELKNSGAISEIAESSSPATGIWEVDNGFEWKGKTPGVQGNFGAVFTSPEFGKTIGWTFREGRDFSHEFATDSSAMILNEAAAKFMDLKHPVGENIRWDGKAFHVIGVVRDMVMGSPYNPAFRTVFVLNNEPQSIINIRINPSMNVHDALAKIEPFFKKYNPSQPFDIKFVDEEYARKFGEEERVGRLAGFFTLLAIFISCLGLFGMASFMAEQRFKEIGIRKILGASVFTLWRMLSKDFVLLIFISLLIAMPVAYFFMHNWLLKYDYRSEISWWIFAMAAAGALAVTLLTISFQSIKAAMANPVKSLRTE